MDITCGLMISQDRNLIRLFGSMPRIRTPPSTEKTDKNYIKETNSSDQCIYINDPITRYRAIRWRLNTFLNKKICPICHREMNRAHIQKCKLFMHVPFWHFICNDDIYTYKSELRKYGDHPPPNYNRQYIK